MIYQAVIKNKDLAKKFDKILLDEGMTFEEWLEITIEDYDS